MTETKTSEVLLEELNSDGICVLTINRPDAMNSMNGELVRAFETRFAALNKDDHVRVVILTAAGDRVFCAGADLKERQQMTTEEVSERIASYQRTFEIMSTLSKPTICAINGYAFGGGLEIALACDLRVAALEAQVGLTELRLGIIPGAGGTQRLARLVGPSKAKDLLFRAARLTGKEAVEWGVVNYAVPRSELLDFSIGLAKQIVRSAPIAVAQAKRAVDFGIDLSLPQAILFERECYAVTIPTEDRLEGLAAFSEKRDPVWKNK